jgi:hypothetical protein
MEREAVEEEKRGKVTRRSEMHLFWTGGKGISSITVLQGF